MPRSPGLRAGLYSGFGAVEPPVQAHRALGAPHERALVEDELPANRALEGGPAQHREKLLLERAGLLRRDPTKPRALELVGREKAAENATAELPKLPLLGQIAAGGPLLAEENVEDEIAVPENLRGDFLLRVKGDSMIEAGILDGDVVVVRRADDARDGEIVVALAGDDETADEATVKRFFRENGRVRLQPENSALEPIYADYVQVLGKVVGVFREL